MNREYSPRERTLSACWIVLFGFVVLTVLVNRLWAEDNTEKPLYEDNFAQAEIGKLPADVMSLNGDFVVKEEGTNRFLELPGAPLDAFAAMFGPTERTNVMVSARVFGTARGRRYPTFGVGLGGVSGYHLQVSPGKDALEIYKDQDLKISVRYKWKPGAWTLMRLQVRNVGDAKWKIEGKAWSAGTPEPGEWQIV